jgi:hypothetical protein
MKPPCRRASGAFRAFFATKEEAEAFRDEPRNVDYHGDIPNFCGRCDRWHLSRPEWLVPEHQRVMTVVN